MVLYHSDLLSAWYDFLQLLRQHGCAGTVSFFVDRPLLVQGGQKRLEREALCGAGSSDFSLRAVVL